MQWVQEKKLQKINERQIEDQCKLKMQQKEMEFLFKQQERMQNYKGTGDTYTGVTGLEDSQE